MTPLRAAAFVGFVLATAVAARDGSLLALLTAFGPSVAVPLGLEVALVGDPLARRARLDVAMAVACVVASLGFLGERGSLLAIACVLPYALACAACGALGLARAWARRAARFGPLPEAAIDVALLFLPAAAAWLVAARAGRPLAGFGEPVVTFTAVHFHVAGFAAPTILGGVGRLLAKTAHGAPARYPYAVLAVCGGVPLTAIGIATTHAVESASAVVLAGGMLLAASVLVVSAARAALPTSRVAAALFVVSGGVLFLSMALATAFALSASAGRGGSLAGLVPLSSMIAWHGGANALGFALPGLLALVRTSPRAT